ncbi:MAG: (d)CMP kinase [Candidatus Omnitrophica bacterium]|nr:(d)CMP kinase [Candidatus Omnitrophota bacterium]
MIITIDGPAGAGKSTVARLLAKALGFIYIDTGAMYRALTLKAIEEGINFHDQQALTNMSRDSQLEITNNQDGSIRILLDGADVSSEIRSPRITQYVSDIAKIKGVRQEMLKLQRILGESADSVLDGRDIGTVVFPEADKKFYLDADFQERARRRHEEFKDLGNKLTRKDVEIDLENRDNIDSTRSCAPLKKADDAIYVDTTNMTIDEVVAFLMAEVKKVPDIRNQKPNIKNQK